MRFVGGEFYHIYNRGVEGRDIFVEPTDYQRFLNGLLAFNTKQSITLREFDYVSTTRNEQLCSLICYTLMKNHVHFVVRCLNPEDLSLFLQKLFIGYTAYFNSKYSRVGVLFQGGSKSRHLNTDQYIGHVVDYVHLNPLDYTMPEWRAHGVTDSTAAKNELLHYPYSSLRGFLGLEDDPALDMIAMKEIMPNHKFILDSMIEWASGSLESSDAVWEG